VRAIESLSSQLARQTAVLERLADTWAPSTPVVDQRVIKATTGIDHLDATELALVDQFVARSENEQGHTPTEEEILVYLADERTIDLHTRLREREVEVQQILSQRSGR